jgi:hypothetical protein
MFVNIYTRYVNACKEDRLRAFYHITYFREWRVALSYASFEEAENFFRAKANVSDQLDKRNAMQRLNPSMKWKKCVRRATEAGIREACNAQDATIRDLMPLVRLEHEANTEAFACADSACRRMRRVTGGDQTLEKAFSVWMSHYASFVQGLIHDDLATKWNV